MSLYEVNATSADIVLSEARNLTQLWASLTMDEKRALVEAITDKIIVGKDEIDITLCYLPSCKEMAEGWRKGRDSNPR